MTTSKALSPGALFGLLIALIAALLLPGLMQHKLLFSTVGFDPHGHCFLWKPEILRLYVVSDSLIGSSYVAISFVLAYLVFRLGKDLVFPHIFLAFGAFIVFCGITHFMDIWTLWNPTYWLSGYMKMVTAIASAGTALMLPPLVPKIRKLIHDAQMSQEQQRKLVEINRRLQQEIAERHSAEAALRAAEIDLQKALQKERELNDLKKRFITRMSHEFRTPLAIVGTSSHILQHNADKLKPAQKERHYRLIQDQVQHIANLLDDILMIGSVEAGGTKFEPISLDVAMFCQYLISDFAAATKRNIEFTMTKGCGSIVADQGLIYQAITGLLGNAAKYSESNSVIQVHVECVNNELMIHIQDYGMGIPERDKARIFENFYRGSNIVNIAGTGSGLPLVKHAVEQHGGRLTFVSEVGKGSTFTIHLPLHVRDGH